MVSWSVALRYKVGRSPKGLAAPAGRGLGRIVFVLGWVPALQ